MLDTTAKTFYLRVFLSYIKEVTTLKGVTTHKLLKDCNIDSSLVQNCKRLLAGKKSYVNSISLPLLIHIYNCTGVPFNLSECLMYLEEEEQSSLNTSLDDSSDLQ